MVSSQDIPSDSALMPPEVDSEIQIGSLTELALGRELNSERAKAEQSKQNPLTTPSWLTADSEFEYFSRTFKSLDQNNDDFITTKEISTYLEANKTLLNKSATTALNQLRENIGKLEELHNDENGDENSGITRADLKTGETRMKAYEFAQKHFNEIDQNQDEFIEPSELDLYQNSSKSKLNNWYQTSLGYLIDNISTIEEQSNDEFLDENNGITAGDLKNARTFDHPQHPKPLGNDGCFEKRRQTDKP